MNTFKKNAFNCIFFIPFFVLSQQKKIVYPDFTNSTFSEIENNKGWKILVFAKGYLNLDTQNDFAVVLESKDSVFEYRHNQVKKQKNKARIILVMINVNNQLKVISQNNVFIARPDEGGMLPYLAPEIFIKNNQLTIYYQYTRANISYSFEYENNQMVLIEAKSTGVTSATGDFESDHFDFKKKRIVSEAGHISSDVSKKEIHLMKSDIELKKLSEFKQMYEWEIIENKFL